MRSKSTLLIFLLSLFVNGCASLNSVSLTSVPKERNNPIKVTKHKWVILGLNFDNDFVDEMNDELRQQCKEGKATGLLTKDEYYLYPFVSKRVVTVSGYCVAQGK